MKKVYKDEDVWIVSLVEDPSRPVLKGFTFDGCTIFGPAVITAVGENNTWTKNTMPAKMFSILPEGQKYLAGVIGLEDCIVTGCSFVGVGLIGKKTFISRFFD